MQLLVLLLILLRVLRSKFFESVLSFCLDLVSYMLSSSLTVCHLTHRSSGYIQPFVPIRSFFYASWTMCFHCCECMEYLRSYVCFSQAGSLKDFFSNHKSFSLVPCTVWNVMAFVSNRLQSIYIYVSC